MSKHLFRSTTLRAAVIAVILVMQGGAEGSRRAALVPIQGHPKPPTVLGRCEPEMVHELFPARSPAGAEPRPELRVLITRFAGSDARSQAFGVQVGKSLRGLLNDHARLRLNAVQSELPASAVRVELVLCELGDHEHARAIGEAGGADIVLWGQAFCNGCTPRQIQHVQIDIHAEGANSNNTLSQSPNAVMTNNVHVVKPQITVTPPLRTTEGSFATSLTLVRWQGLDAGTGRLVEFKRLDKVASLSLPQMGSGGPELLLNVALGIYASRAGQHGLATEFFQSASKDVPAGVEGVHRLHRMIGTSYLITGHQRHGLDALKAALRACPTYDLGCRQVGLTELGWAEFRFGSKSEALDFFEQSLSLALRRSDRLSEATAINNLGLVYAARGEQAKALSYYERALSLRQTAGDVSGEAGTLNNFGLICAARGEQAKALSYYERALLLSKKEGDFSGEAVTLNHLGLVYFALGEKAKAVGYFERALPLNQKVEDVLGEATTLSNFGLVYNSLGERDKALGFLERALGFAQKGGEPSIEGTTHDNIGLVLRDLGRLPESVHSFQLAAASYSRLEHFHNKKAQRSLDQAFGIALSGQLVFEAQAVLKELAGPGSEGGAQGALRRARLAGLSGAAEATAYQALRALADSASATQSERESLLALAQAGQTRAIYRASWPSCDGLVITETRPASQAVALGLRAGDVLLRCNGQCLQDSSDLHTATPAGKPVLLELWRGTGVVRLYANSSDQLVGIRTAAF